MGATEKWWEKAPLAEDKPAASGDRWWAKEPLAEPEAAPSAAPPATPVSGVDAYARGVGKTVGESGRLAGRALAGTMIPIDFVASLFGMEPGAIVDPVARLLVDPAQRNVDYGTIKPGEQLDTAGKAAYGVGNLVGMLPEIVAGAPGRASLGRVVESVAPKATQSTAGAIVRQAAPEVAGAVPSAAVRGSSRAEELRNQGASPVEAGIAGAISTATTPLMFAVPAAAPGGLVTRAATGAASNVVQNNAQVGLENQVLPPSLRGQYFGEGDITAALIGGMFGAAGGRGPRIQTPAEIQGYRDAFAAKQVAAQQRAEGYARWQTILEANGVGPDDPRAPQLVAMLDAREAQRAEAQAQARAAMSPEEQALADGQQPPQTIVVDSQGRAAPPGMSGTKAGVMSAEGTAAKSEREARGAFDMAGATAAPREPDAGQRGRKQQAADEGSMTGQPRDLRDASAGGTTTPEGTAATTPETFNFLDVQRDGAGNVTGTGPQVEIVQEGLTIKRGKEEIPAVEIAYTGPDGQSVTAVVPASRVTALSRPKNPRFAQTVEGDTLNTPGPAVYRRNSYSPARGVGTGPDQPQPRNAAQRITTDEPATLERAQRPEPEPVPQREPDTVDSTAARVGEPRQLEDRSRGLPDNGQRNDPLLLTNDPLSVGGPEQRPALPGPDTPRPDGQMVAGDEGVRQQTYGDSQRRPGEPYIPPRKETPIVGGEKPPGEDAPFVRNREATGESQADRLRNTIADLEARRDRYLERPGFKRTAVDKTRLKDIEQRIADAKEQLRRLLESGVPERRIVTPEAPRTGRPVEVVNERAPRERTRYDGEPPPDEPPPAAAAPRGTPPADGGGGTPPTPRPATRGRTTGGRRARERTGSRLLSDIIRLGGINVREALDTIGERAFVANRVRPGLFRRNGRGMDELAHDLWERGWLTDEQYNDPVDGGVQALRDLIWREAQGERAVPMDSIDAWAEAEMRRQWEDAAEREAAAANTDPFEMFDVLEEGNARDANADAVVDVALEAEARAKNPDAVESLPDSLEPDAYNQELRRILDDANAQETGGTRVPEEGQGTGRGPEPQEGRQAGQDGAGGGILEQPTPDALRERERAAADERARVAREERAAEDRARADRERDNFGLTGSDRPADQNPGQDDMFGNSERKPGTGGGTLYAGMPLDKMVEELAKAWNWTMSGPVGRWITKDIRKFIDGVREFASDVRETLEKVPGVKGAPVTKFLRSILDSAAGEIRYKASKYNSPTLDRIIDHFHTLAGSTRETGDTYQQAVHAHVNKTLTRISKALGDLVGDREAMKQVANQVRNPGSIRRGTPIGDAAAEVSKILKEQLEYMRAAGVEIGEVPDGYYPREFDQVAISRDVEGFVRAAAGEYQRMGMDAEAANAAARELADHLQFDGGIDSMLKGDRGNVRTPFMKGRVFGKDVDREAHPLNRFLVSDPAVTLSVYVQRAARRAEIARRFGDGFEWWGELSSDRRRQLVKEKGEAWVKENTGITRKIIEEGAGNMVGELRDFVALGAGLRRPGVSMGSIRAASALRTWSTLAFLEKATLSSLTEFLVPALRSGNALDVARSLRSTVRDLGRSIAKGTVEADALRELAEDVGIIAGRVHDTINAARFSGGEPVSQLESKILEKYFKRTGLTAWTDATRMGALDVGRAFLRRSALRAADGKKLGRRNLVEAGVPEAKVDEFTKWLSSTGEGMPSVADLAKAPKEMASLYRQALRRFSTQSIMHPDATLKPKWMSTPWGSIIGQLQSFNYAFYENVLKRQGRMLKEAATGKDYTAAERASMTLAPAVTMTMMYGLAYAIGEARDALLGDPNRRKTETAEQKAIKAASRALPIAPLDPFVNLISAARYQRGTVDFFSGPALGTAGRAIDAGIGLAVNNSEKTNTAERAAAKAVWDLVIEPATNLALAATTGGTLGTVLSGAVTQAVGAGEMREGFVAGVAGADNRRRRGESRL